MLPALLMLGSALYVYRGYVVLAAARGERLQLSARHVATFTRESAARAVLTLLTPLAVGRARLPSEPTLSSPPVVLVPGGWNRSSMWFLRAFLRRRGRVVMIVDRLRRDSSLAEDAMALKEVTTEICARMGTRRVDLVGFDRGGLVAAWYAKHLGGAETTRRLVCLGTPWRGTRTSVFRAGGAELRWDNPVLDPLVPPPIPTVCIWSPDDPEVVPTVSSAPTHGIDGVCLDGAGHYELLLSARAFRAVEAALRGAAEVRT